jgi:xanthine/CO dehydrogenase XdhC/CoxF family maturation factor
MKDLVEIIHAFETRSADSSPCALATVVRVEGSAYRRPGARMLIAQDGDTWGGVSGGCLERDVASRARGVIATGRPVLCRYDTTDDESIGGDPSIATADDVGDPSAAGAFAPQRGGAATGCWGVVEVFIQPVSSRDPGPLATIARVLRSRQATQIATIIGASGNQSEFVAACWEPLDTSASGPTIDPGLRQWAQQGTHDAAAFAEPSESNGNVSAAAPKTRAFIHHYRSPAGNAIVFIEPVKPPPPLVIFGAGPDVVPVVTIAASLGWNVTVVGSRPATGIAQRFAHASTVQVTGADDPLAGVRIEPGAAVVLMTHNLARDTRILARLPRTLAYLGILGPKRRSQRLLAGLQPSLDPTSVFAPVGLDLGAETPHEIALAIIAEIQSVFRQSSARSLRDRPGPIHPPTTEPAPGTDSISDDAAGDSPSAQSARRPTCPI